MTNITKAAQDAIEAIEWLLRNINRDAPQLSGKAMGNAETCANALRAALTQRPAAQPTPEAIREHLEGVARRTTTDEQFNAFKWIIDTTFESLDLLPAPQQATPEPSVPAGWHIFRAHNGIDVHAPDGGVCYVEAKATAARRIPEEVLHALCCDLLAPQHDTVVPDGFALVPVKPSAEMLKAMESQWLIGSQSDMALREFKAMLDAAQKGN